MFLHRRWIKIGFIALSVVAGWRLSFWMPQPIVNAQETVADKATPKSAEEQAEAEQLKRVEPLAQLLKKLYPDMPLQVMPVGSAVLLRGDVWSQELQKQLVEIAKEFFNGALDQLNVDPLKRPRIDQTKAAPAKLLQIGEDKYGLRALFGKLYPTATIEVNVVSDNVVLIRGRATRQADITPICEIAEQYFPKVLMALTAADQP